MSVSEVITLSWANQAPLNLTLTGGELPVYSFAVPATTTYDPFALAFTLSKLQSFIILVDQNVTLYTNGVAQVNTATVVGTCTGSGSMSVVVTASGMTGSPRTVSVPVLNTDSATVMAGKCRTALAADVDVGPFFTVAGTGANLVLTAKTPAANDGTMNIATSTGSATGITTEASSTATTAGVAVQDTIALTAGIPYVWYAGSPQSAIFASNVTTGLISNPGGSSANVVIRFCATAP